MSPLGVILLLGMTTPQNQVVTVPQNDAEGAVRHAAEQAVRHAVEQAAQQALGRARRSPEVANLCFAIRSYIFERQDGNAPVLVRTTTCTPASTIQRQQVANPPKVRLVPQ